MTESTSYQPKQVYELEGMLVAPRPEAPSTFEDYAAARATFIEINDDARWNPWVHETSLKTLLAVPPLTGDNMCSECGKSYPKREGR